MSAGSFRRWSRPRATSAEVTSDTIRERQPHLRDGDMLLRVEDLVVEYPAGPDARVHAVSKISFDVLERETLGLVGESGCGKSSAGRAVLCLPRPTAGRVVFEGTDLVALPEDELRRIRPRLQPVFQDPISSLNPRRTVGDVIAEPLIIWGPVDRAAMKTRVAAMMEAVGLNYDTDAGRYASELSGGQCQRVSIARALMLSPKLLVCDEPVASLDVSVQAQILNLLQDLRDHYGLTMIFISHDLAVVKNVSDRIAVMYLGKVCEVGSPEVLYEHPAHHYTAALVASIPLPTPHTRTHVPGSAGELPSAIDPPSGCRFRTRCPAADDRCADEEPPLRALGPDHSVACHHPSQSNARRLADSPHGLG